MEDRQGCSIDISYWSFHWSFDLTFALLFGSHYGFMAGGTDCNKWVYKSKKITEYAILLGQIPQWCSWTLASQTFMSFIRRFQLLPDPTQSLVEVRVPIPEKTYTESLQEIEHKVNEHHTKKHTCGKSLVCKVLSEYTSRGIEGSEHTESVNILFEAL